MRKVKELFRVNKIENFLLIDDYSQNIIEWEDAGGIGIKYFNEYNSPQHPMNGVSISNFKLFGNEKNKIHNNILLVGLNKYKSNLIEKNLLAHSNFTKVNLLECVVKDMKEKLQLDEIKDIYK